MARLMQVFAQSLQVRRSRMLHVLRSRFTKFAFPAIALSALALPAQAAGTKTITAVMHSDLRVTDPIITTAYITRDHGYMVYDTLDRKSTRLNSSHGYIPDA